MRRGSGCRRREGFSDDRGLPPRAVFGEGLDHVAEVGSSFGVVFDGDVCFLGDAAGREKGVEGLVATAVGFHFPKVCFGPRVHGDGPHKAEVDTQPPVLAGAVQAHEHAI